MLQKITGRKGDGNDKKVAYETVLNQSAHGLFSIEGDEEEDIDSDSVTDIENRNRSASQDGRRSIHDNNDGSYDSEAVRRVRGKHIASERVEPEIATAGLCLPLVLMQKTWSTLTFSWVRPLLTVGNSRALEQSDLYDLHPVDSAVGVYAAFRKQWIKQLNKLGPKGTTPLASGTGAAAGAGVSASPSLSNGNTKKDGKGTPSLAMACIHAFGSPFFAAGGLKLIHDSCLFVGPLLLNAIIKYLNNPNQKIDTGMMYVAGLFAANFVMSLCLRQYFW
jgi:hypothetical protein